jgi:hypothetical protein
LLQKTKLFRARNATFACFFGIMCPDRALGTPGGPRQRQVGYSYGAEGSVGSRLFSSAYSTGPRRLVMIAPQLIIKFKVKPEEVADLAVRRIAILRNGHRCGDRQRHASSRDIPQARRETQYPCLSPFDMWEPCRFRRSGATPSSPESSLFVLDV